LNGALPSVEIAGGFHLDKLARFLRNSPDMKTSTPSVLITFALVCFALAQNAQAVSPPPDGGYPGFTTAEGTRDGVPALELEHFAQQTNEFISLGLLRESSGNFVLTQKGRELADSVAEGLV
jgi:hypothetical protein